nr:hypothetical protein [Tanacetum cinerariifolium]
STTASTSGISPDVAELKDMVRPLLLDKKGQSPAPEKAFEESCVTCGCAHSYRNCPATDGMAECLALEDLSASINLMPYSVWKRLSLSDLSWNSQRRLRKDWKSSNRCVRSDFLLEEVYAFLSVEDEPTSSEFCQPYLDPEGDILLLEAFLNDDPSPPPYQGNYMPEVRKELKICEAHSEKS